MTEISYNSIFDGVSIALHKAFPETNIHGGTVMQDLMPGDFNVLPITPQHSRQMGSRAKRGVVFDIIYYATDEGGREDCLDKAHALPQVIGTITTPQGCKVHGTGFEYSIDDDVLHCIVSYPHFVYSPADGVAMETFEIK